MRYVAATERNPFGMQFPCERYVPGYGDVNADFHVVGDNPAVHGGRETRIPFTDRPWSDRFFDALARGGLVDDVSLDAGTLAVSETFLSYLHPCDPGDSVPDADDYAEMEPFFDSELRAITAHVLFPVGPRATKHVFDHYTSRTPAELDMDALHASERRGSGWLVVPIKDPAEWAAGDADRLADALVALRETDYRRTADLGRFLADDDSYLVR